MKMEIVHDDLTGAPVEAAELEGLLGAPEPRSWRRAAVRLEALPGWWVSAGYWDREAVEDWFARPLRGQA